MATSSVRISNRTLALDKDGYLANLDDWSIQVAEELALHPGRIITRSDLIREVLYAHVKTRREKKTVPPKRGGKA